MNAVVVRNLKRVAKDHSILLKTTITLYVCTTVRLKDDDRTSG